MASAKDIIIKPITAQAATKLVKAIHYSGKVAANSQLHFGVFLNGRLEGAMQFGPSLDKRKTQALVDGTGWNGFLELNRMAFSDVLPRNSESRALGVAFRLIKKHYPHIEWIVSFSDGTQCGDGTIYRASGFCLTGIKKNTSIWEAPDGTVSTDPSLRLGQSNKAAPKIVNSTTVTKSAHIKKTGASSMKPFKEAGYKPKAGFQLRYVYFLNPEARQRLTVPTLPFSKIDEVGAGMYKGKARAKQAITDDQSAERQGSTDPHAPNKKGPRKAAPISAASEI